MNTLPRIDRLEKSRKLDWRLIAAGLGLVALTGCGSANATHDAAPQPVKPVPAATATPSAELPFVAPSSEAPTPEVTPPTYTPHQKIGTLSLTVSGMDRYTGAAPLRRVVTEPLEVDGQQPGQPFNANDDALMHGFMLNSDSNPIGWLPVGAVTSEAHNLTVIAGHRNTPVNGSKHGPSKDLPSVQNGDILTYTPFDGPKAVYTAIEEGKASVTDFETNVLNRTTTQDQLLIYGCADANGIAGGDDYRTYVVLQRTA